MAVLKISDFGITNRKNTKRKNGKTVGGTVVFPLFLLTKDLVNPLHFYVNRKITFVKSTRNFYS